MSRPQESVEDGLLFSTFIRLSKHKFVNFFELLSIDMKQEGTAQFLKQIDENYKVLVRMIHPDKYPGREREYGELCKLLNSARDILLDTNERKKHIDEINHKGATQKPPPQRTAAQTAPLASADCPGHHLPRMTPGYMKRFLPDMNTGRNVPAPIQPGQAKNPTQSQNSILNTPIDVIIRRDLESRIRRDQESREGTQRIYEESKQKIIEGYQNKTVAASTTFSRLPVVHPNRPSKR